MVAVVVTVDGGTGHAAGAVEVRLRRPGGVRMGRRQVMPGVAGVPTGLIRGW